MTSVFVLIGAFVISVVLLFASVLGFKAWRKRDARRSPLNGKKLANLPGQQLMARVTDHGDELIIATMLMYFAIPVMLCAWAINRVRWKDVRFGFNEGLFAFAAVALFLFGLRSFIRHWDASVTFP